MLEHYKIETYIFKLCINTLPFDLSKNAERYIGKTKRVMLRELGSETDDRAARGREHQTTLFCGFNTSLSPFDLAQPMTT
jgi:hypothetical protein